MVKNGEEYKIMLRLEQALKHGHMLRSFLLNLKSGVRI